MISCLGEHFIWLRVIREALTARRQSRAVIRPKAMARTNLKIARPEGTAKCMATQGKLELRQDRDFSAIDRARLEQAVTAFFAALDE